MCQLPESTDGDSISGPPYYPKPETQPPWPAPQAPFALPRASLLIITLTIIILVCQILAIVGNWYTVEMNSEDDEWGDEERTTVSFKFSKIDVEYRSEYDGEVDREKESYDYDDPELRDLFEECDSVMFRMKVLAYLVLILAIVSIFIRHQKNVGILLMVLAVTCLGFSFLGGLMFATTWPEALDESNEDDDSEGFYESMGGNRSFYGSARENRYGDDRTASWHPSLSWYLTMFVIPILAGLAIVPSNGLRTLAYGGYRARYYEVQGPAPGWYPPPTHPSHPSGSPYPSQPPPPLPPSPPWPGSPTDHRYTAASGTVICPGCRFQIPFRDPGYPLNVNCPNCGTLTTTYR